MHSIPSFTLLFFHGLPNINSIARKLSQSSAMAAPGAKIGKATMAGRFKKSYFDVLGLCCSSEVPLIEKILSPLDGVKEVTVIVPSRTVIVVHDELLLSQSDIVKLLNQARLEASVRVLGQTTYQKRWPSPYAVVCGGLLLLSFLKYVYQPFQWLAIAAVAVGIFPIALKAVAAIRSFRFNISILVLITVAGTIFLHDYIEAGTIVFLFIIADWLEARASHKATAVMSSLLSMAPQKAVLAESGEVVAVEDVKVGSVIAVKAGELIPVDGVVVEGKCEVDERTLTGESFPKAKQMDSIVWAGTINLNGYICVKTTVLAEDCVVARMAKLVEEAQNKKSTTQRLVDKCTQYYTPAIILVSAGIACIPFILHVGDRNKWILLALVVLVSACPCALVLSTPVATFCALSKAATNGLLIKGGNHLETLAKTKTMAFDKTGTLTTGEFVVKNIQPLQDDINFELLLYWVSSLESKSSHPMAAAFVDYAKSRSVMPRAEMVEEYEVIPGEGIHGRINGVDVYVGNEKMAVRAACAYPLPTMSSAEGETIGWIYSHSSAIGMYSLSDTCRSGVVEAVAELKLMGVRTAMLTGDSNSAAMEVQKQAGNAIDDIHSGLLPEQKASIIKDYQKHGQTAMVGDGLNDTIALATADVGISMGISGSALASETGNMILMTNDVRKLPKAVKLARRARRKIVENIVISITTKTAILALAFAGYPLVWAAVLADTGTCLVVILNSMLLLRGVDGTRHCAKHDCKKQVGEGHCAHDGHVECNTASHQSQPCCRAARHPDCSTTVQRSPECGGHERCSHTTECHSKAEHTAHEHCCSHAVEAEHTTHTSPGHCCSHGAEARTKSEHAACSSTCSGARNVVPEHLPACGATCSAHDYGRCCRVSRRKCGRSCRVEFCEKHACGGAHFGPVLSEIAIE